MKTNKILILSTIFLSFSLYLGIIWQKVHLAEKKEIAASYLSLVNNPSINKYIDSVKDTEFAYILSELLPYNVDMEKILYGANVRVEDEGALYRKWSSSPYAYKRISSHKQQKNSSKAISHLLFYLDCEGNTRFQIEKTPTKGFFCYLLHSLDYLSYLCSGKQLGILGVSEHTEAFPLEE